jgi:hypothetical protein
VTSDGREESNCLLFSVIQSVVCGIGIFFSLTYAKSGCMGVSGIL